MSAEQPDIIKCACGQRMRVPAESQSNVFKCVKCGALVERDQEDGANTRTGIFLRRTPNQRLTAQDGSALTGHDVLLNIFFESGLINQEQLQLIRNAHKPGEEKVFETLLRLEIISQDHFHAFMAKESGTAAINLANFSIDRALTELIPLELAIKHWVLPIDKLGRSLTVAMACPMDTEAISAVEHHTGLRLRPMLCKMQDFQLSLRKHYKIPDSDENLQARPAVKPPVKSSPAPASAPQEVSATPQPQVERQAIHGVLPVLETLPISARLMNQIDATVGTGVEGLRQIIAIVEKSPPFAAKILSLANSRAFGLPGSVESIAMAVALLGEEAISIVAAATPKYTAASERQWTALKRFSRNAAELASVFAAASGRVVPGVAFCAALLHGIGSYALAEAAEEDYRKVDPESFGMQRLLLEEQIMGIGHTEAGAILCRSWNLPEGICSAVHFYLNPADAGNHRDIAELVFIATHLATPDGEINREGLLACNNAFAHLNVSKTDVSSVIQQRLGKHLKS